MANDILIINESKDINDINIICSTKVNGSSSILLSQDNYPLDLTIDNIQSKFDHKFDEITYYTRYNSSENSGISPSPTPTITPTVTVTPTVTPTRTVTPTVTPTRTVTPTVTPTRTVTPTPTTTVTPTPTVTPSATVAVQITTNSCNFNNCADWDGLNGNVTTIGSNGISSPYNAHDMNGNLWEWNEAIISASTRCIRGAAWNNGSTYLAATSRTSQNTTYFLNNLGLRLATITNPYSFNTFVDIIDTGNTQDANGYGAVSYSYKIHQYLVTNSEYIEFLNAVAQTDDNGLYPSIMSTDLRSGIIRSGTNGSYSYTAKINMNNKPVNFISWYNAARFANWLHNNKPNGLQTNSTTEGGAYQLTGNTGQPSRDFGAKYFIPTENEWYKAAYYKAGSTNAGYWKYATRSATLPSCVSASVNGNGVTS